MAAKAKSIDEYIASVNGDKRAVLERLRKTIRAAAPKAEECISYGLPAFRFGGKPLVAFSASANHYSFFPMNSTTVAAHKNDLKDCDISKGTIRFPADKPLPVALVRKLVKARIAENERKTQVTKSRSNTQTDPAVSAFLTNLDHPLKKEIDAVRQIILGVSPEIREGIKWNSPSFRTVDWFATVNVRAKDGTDRVWLILHMGATARGKAMQGKIADPAGLLQWLAKDRCLVTFDNIKDVRAKRATLEKIVRTWIRQV